MGDGMNILRKIRIILLAFKIPIFYIQVKGNVRKLIWMDAARWLQKTPQSINGMEVFYLLISNQNFASVYNYRFKKNKIVYKLKQCFFDENHNIEINTPDIGGGLLIPHNFGCVISAQKIGNNCQIDQGVTIGKSGSGKEQIKEVDNKPTIGNNVMITTNSIVIGNIHIGDNAIIGAGSVVTKDVPQNAVIIGNPQRILRYQEE